MHFWCFRWETAMPLPHTFLNLSPESHLPRVNDSEVNCKWAWKQLWWGDAPKSKGWPPSFTEPTKQECDLDSPTWFDEHFDCMTCYRQCWGVEVVVLGGVRSTKWVFKGSSCQAGNVSLISALSVWWGWAGEWGAPLRVSRHLLGKVSLIRSVGFENVPQLQKDHVAASEKIFGRNTVHVSMFQGIPSQDDCSWKTCIRSNQGTRLKCFALFYSPTHPTQVVWHSPCTMCSNPEVAVVIHGLAWYLE